MNLVPNILGKLVSDGSHNVIYAEAGAGVIPNAIVEVVESGENVRYKLAEAGEIPNGLVELIGGGSSTPWTPDNLLTTNKLWFDPTDATTITESSGLVSEWRDSITGSTFKFSQPTGASQLTTGTTTINGENVLVSTARDYMQTLEKTPGSYPSSIQVTCLFQKAGAEFTNESLVCRNYTGDADPEPMNRFNQYLGAGSRTSFVYTTMNNIKTMTTPTMLSYYVNNAPFCGEYENGTLVNEGNYGRTYSDAQGQYIFLGAAFSASYGFNGYWGDVVITDELTESERQKLEGYLAHKWGQTANLPVAHPYKSEAPTV